MPHTARPFEIEEYLNDYTVLLSENSTSTDGNIEVRTEDGEVVPARVVGKKHDKLVAELLISDLESYAQVV